MKKILDWFKKIFTSKTFKVILVKFCIYAVIYFIVLHFMFEIFWDESLLDVMFKE